MPLIWVSPSSRSLYRGMEEDYAFCLFVLVLLASPFFQWPNSFSCSSAILFSFVSVTIEILTFCFTDIYCLIHFLSLCWYLLILITLRCCYEVSLKFLQLWLMGVVTGEWAERMYSFSLGGSMQSNRVVDARTSEGDTSLKSWDCVPKTWFMLCKVIFLFGTSNLTWSKFLGSFVCTERDKC